jgi:tetratricopeptide (TPR) repeat protein
VKESRKTNLLIVFSLLMIAAAFAAYSAVVLRWFSSPRAGASERPSSFSMRENEKQLASARREFRERLLDPRAHLRLSEALWKNGRLVDSFYVAYAARQLFGEEEFHRAHADIVLGVGGPATELSRRLDGLREASLAVPIHVEIIRRYADTAEGRASLDALERLASSNESSGGEAAHLAKTALEELSREDPKHSGKLAALGLSLLTRGDLALADAVASEALSKNPGHAGAARVKGALALQRRDLDDALRWLNAAWERNHDDLYSAAKLAQIYDKLRSDPEGALSFHLALYRHNPDFSDADVPVENRIQEILTARRESLLRNVTAAGLDSRFDLEDATLRAEACLRAAAFKDPRWIDKLGALLDDDVEIVRRDADYALFEIGKADPDAVRARREKWLGSDNPLRRIRALNLYADLDGHNALPSVIQALRDPNPAVRAFSKVMVLEHYYRDSPETAKIRERYLAEEKDPGALALMARFPPPR